MCMHLYVLFKFGVRVPSCFKLSFRLGLGLGLNKVNQRNVGKYLSSLFLIGAKVVVGGKQHHKLSIYCFPLVSNWNRVRVGSNENH